MAKQDIKDFINPVRIRNLREVIGSIISILTALAGALAAFQAGFGG